MSNEWVMVRVRRRTRERLEALVEAQRLAYEAGKREPYWQGEAPALSDVLEMLLRFRERWQERKRR